MMLNIIEDDGSINTLNLVSSLQIEDEINDLNKMIDHYLKNIYDPYKRNSSLRKLISKLPQLDNVNINEETLTKLEKNNLVIIFTHDNQKHISLTLEGMVISHIIKSKGLTKENVWKFDNSIYHTYDNLLLNKYKDKIYEKIYKHQNLQVTEKTLGVPQLSITLFLLINGSIGEDKAFILNNETSEAVNKITSEFVNFNNSERKVYPFNWYLTTANEVLKSAIYNSNPKYYIKNDKIDEVYNAIKNSIKSIKDFEGRWKAILLAYDNQKTVLRSNNVSHHSYLKTIELERNIIGDN